MKQVMHYYIKNYRSGSRISLRGANPKVGGGTNLLFSQIFTKKTHGNENKLGRGAGASVLNFTM